MKRSVLVGALLGLAFTPAVWAQPTATPKTASDPAIETVIVTGKITTDEATHNFIQNYAAPAPFLGKFARWNKRNPVCPSAGGFPSGYDRFTVNRIKEVAAMVGAPVSQKAGCKPNMSIIVTKDAQGLMGEIRAHRTDLLGYYQSDAQADNLATMHFPVQVLYETATIDLDGHVVRDTDRWNPQCPDGNPSACVYATTGQRARDGLESAFYNVTVVVDAAKVDEYRLQMGALADYLAMVALSQTENFTPCEQLPSISSLMTPNCGTSGLVNAITATDVAYLKGVYTMDSGGSAIVQRGGIAGEVRKSLEGR
jgi:hypothetical protein